MKLWREIGVGVALAVGTLPQRLGAAVVTVIGVATVVAVMTCILAMGAGVRRFVDVTDQPNRALVLSAASPSELTGTFTPGEVGIISAAPGIKHMPDGRPMVQPQSAAVVQLVRKKDGLPGYALLRGTGRVGEAMNKITLHLVAGRPYRTGMRELDVGRGIYVQYRGVDLGDKVLIHGAPWTVVGHYVDQGGIDEDSLAGDVDMVRTDLGSPTYQRVDVMLQSAGAYEHFRDALLSNPQLNVKVRHLSEFYRDEMKPLFSLFDFIGFFVGGLMAVGATAGALTTLYAAVDARKREIATLRAIGFSGTSVIVTVMIEAILLAIPGALIGLLVVLVAFNNHGFDANALIFHTALTPGICAMGAGVALAIGLVGGFFPAMRASGLEVAEALRAT